MIDRHEYPVNLRWTGDKQGVAESDDRLPELGIAAPPEFGGPQHEWTPEHLLVASVASCFMTTFLAIAGNSRLEIDELEVPAVGELVRDPDRRYSIASIELRPRILVTDEKDRAKAERIAHKADEACLISRSLRSEIVLAPTIDVAAG